MASKPFFDKGRWRMKWWAGPQAGWRVVTLCRHDGPWSESKKPKKPTREAERISRKYVDLEIQARHGVNVAPIRSHDLAEHLLEYQRQFARTHSAGSVPSLARAARLLLEFADRSGVDTLEAVDAKLCRAFLRWRSETVGFATMKAEKGLLSKVWTEAFLDGSVAVNPWRLAKVPGNPKSEPPPYWNREEFATLCAGCTGWLRDFAVIGANTGLRATALLNLEWRDVSWERNAVVVRAALDKAKRGYQVPMTATANSVLAARLVSVKSHLVFPGVRTGRPMRLKLPYDRMAYAVKKTGLPDKGHYLHILRHTFATNAVMAGVPLITVSSWLGHSSIKMTERYTHIIPLESQRQMERFDMPAAL